MLAAAQNLLVAAPGLGRRSSSRRSTTRTIDPRTVPREIVEKLAAPGRPADQRAGRPATSARSSPPRSAELQAQIDRLAGVVRAGPGVPKPGKQIFVDQCARCHTLFGKGGKVGPDLTTYRRDDLETMLLNIVNPSAEIREGYAGYVVATTDGRTLTGVVVEQDKNVVVLRGSDGKELTLPRDAIEEMKPSQDLAHARGPAQGPERAAGARPVRLSAEHATVD